MSQIFYVPGRGFLGLVWGQGNEGLQPLIQTISCFLGRAWPGCAGPHGLQESGMWRLRGAGTHICRDMEMQGHREVGTQDFRDMGVRGVLTHLLMHFTPLPGSWSPPSWHSLAAAFPACPLAGCGQLQAPRWLRATPSVAEGPSPRSSPGDFGRAKQLPWEIVFFFQLKPLLIFPDGFNGI